MKVLALFLLLSPLAQAASPFTNWKAVSPRTFSGSRVKSTGDALYLRDRGIHTVINLQGTGSLLIRGESRSSRAAEEQAVIRTGLRYFNFPVTMMRKPNAEDRAQILKIVAMMDDPQLQPVYVHCNLGADRTGFIVAVYRVLYQGCSYEAAHREMLRYGKLWTPILMSGQLATLREFAAEQPRLTGTLRQSCPLR